LHVLLRKFQFFGKYNIEIDAHSGGEAIYTGVGEFCGLYTCGEELQKCVLGVPDQIFEEREQIESASMELNVAGACQARFENFLIFYRRSNLAADFLLLIKRQFLSFTIYIIQPKQISLLEKFIACEKFILRVILDVC
jgi:hypothetical protein